MGTKETHYSHRVGWLRAMVLGANDGIISTAALVLGMAAADSSRSTLLTAGMAGLVAGAVSMALGEYVSVASQRDTESSDIACACRSTAATSATRPRTCRPRRSSVRSACRGASPRG